MREIRVSERTKRDVNRRCCGALAAAWCAAAVFVAAAAPEYHDWTAQEGYADAPASWSGSTLPTSTQAPRFTGAGSSYTVKFPAGVIYCRARIDPERTEEAVRCCGILTGPAEG